MQLSNGVVILFTIFIATLHELTILNVQVFCVFLPHFISPSILYYHYPWQLHALSLYIYMPCCIHTYCLFLKHSAPLR